MAPSVVGFSSQLITALSALVYLRWKGIRGTQLEVLSLYRDDLRHEPRPSSRCHRIMRPMVGITAGLSLGTVP